jgi:hypothetical protein
MMAVGLLLLLLGVWVVLRTVVKDDGGDTLVDRVLAL